MEIDKVAMLLSQGIPTTMDKQEVQLLSKTQHPDLKYIKEKQHESNSIDLKCSQMNMP